METEPELDSFLFSLKNTDAAEKELDRQVDQIEASIDKLVKNIEVAGIPLLSHILTLSHDKEELDKLGQALVRIAPRIAQLDELKKRKGVFDMAHKEPLWLMSVFGAYPEFENLSPDSLTEA